MGKDMKKVKAALPQNRERSIYILENILKELKCEFLNTSAVSQNVGIKETICFFIAAMKFHELHLSADMFERYLLTEHHIVFRYGL